MRSVKKTIKQVLALIPPFGRLFAELDGLRIENPLLKQDLQTRRLELQASRVENEMLKQNFWNSQFELEVVRGEKQTLVGELERIKRDLWVAPGHFYSPIPAYRDLKVNEDEVFDIPPAIRGIDLNEIEQIDLLKKFSEFYREQPFTPEKIPGRRYFFENPNYSYTDAIVLYCMIRHLQPRRIVEIGSGYSSCAMLDINELFFDNSIQCTFIDPYPQLLRYAIKDSDFTRIRIVGQRVQDVDTGIFQELEAGDILFIDSSHVAKTGSDVNYILFKILPLLAKGVNIHFHDIFYPFEYPRDWAFEGRAWNEAYVLRAFLQYNGAFEIRFFTTYLIEKHPDFFEVNLPLCLKNTGGNLWLQKTEHDPELNRINAPTARKIKPVPTKIEPSQPEYLWLLGEGWHGGEGDHCWMEDEAALRLAGPEVPGRKLAIRGYSPHIEGAQVTASADEIELGSLKLETAGPLEAEFSLPENLVGKSTITVRLAVDRVFRAPNDPRKLGLSVTAIEII